MCLLIGQTLADGFNASRIASLAHRERGGSAWQIAICVQQGKVVDPPVVAGRRE
jgi:hypothetical protein